MRAGLLLMNASRMKRAKGPIALQGNGKDALRLIADSDAIFVSGVGLFNDTFGARVGAIWALVMRLANILGKPVVVSGQQIGPLNSLLPHVIAKWGLQVASVVGVRDPISLRNAVKLGIPASKVVLTGDDAWDLKASRNDEIMPLLRGIGISDQFVAAQVRFDRATQWTDADAPTLALMIDHLCVLCDAPALFLRTHYASDKDDLDAARAVQAHMKSVSYLMEEELSAGQTKAIIGFARAGIGVSYHFCVFSCSSGVNTIGLYRSAYMNQKMRGLTELCPDCMVGVNLSKPTDLIAGQRRLEKFISRTKSKGGSPHISACKPRCQSTAALEVLMSKLGFKANG